MALEGVQFGHYRLVHLIGSGGMGEVYLAEDTRIPRRVAVKVVRNEADSYPKVEAAKEAVRLFEREMRAITTLDHPNILPLIDFGEEKVNNAVLTYMVMPFRSEGSLVDWLHQQGSATTLPAQDVVHIVLQAAGALQHAHNHQLMHLDVKPANFLIRRREDTPNRPDLLLADFGISKFNTATATASQSIRGTPAYMAPEQWAGSPVAATDQYALAIMAYQLLTGRSPFQGNMQQVMYQHLQELPNPPSTFNSHIPKAVDGVILHALAKKPEDRYPSISVFATAFEQAWHGEEIPVPSRPWVPQPLPSTEYAPPPPPAPSPKKASNSLAAMQTTKSQAELIQRRPILSVRQVAVAVIFGAIAAAFELLQITIPGYLPGVNFSLSGIWLTLSTMIGGPIVGTVVVFVDAVTGQVGIIGWPGFLIHVLILAAFYPAVYRIQGTPKRLGAFLLLTAVALFFQYWWWIGLYSLVLKIIPFWAQITLQFGYAYWIYLIIYFLIPAIVLASVPRYVAPQWRWPW